MKPTPKAALSCFGEHAGAFAPSGHGRPGRRRLPARGPQRVEVSPQLVLGELAVAVRVDAVEFPSQGAAAPCPLLPGSSAPSLFASARRKCSAKPPSLLRPRRAGLPTRRGSSSGDRLPSRLRSTSSKRGAMPGRPRSTSARDKSPFRSVSARAKRLSLPPPRRHGDAVAERGDHPGGVTPRASVSAASRAGARSTPASPGLRCR